MLDDCFGGGGALAVVGDVFAALQVIVIPERQLPVTSPFEMGSV